MKPPTAAIRNGAYVWFVYGVVELYFIAILPWLFRPPHDYRALNAWYSAAVVLFYVLLGGGIAWVSGLVFQRLRERTVHIIPAVALVWLASVAQRSDVPLEFYLASLSMALVITALLVRNAARDRGQSVVTPGIISLVLLTPPALHHSVGLELIPAMAILFGALAVLRLLARVQLPLSSRARTVLTGMALLGVLVATARLNPKPIEVSPPDLADPPEAAPHIILIVLDTVRADHLSVYGYERQTTPFLEEFARGATLYRNSYSAADQTLTSHASLFTGRYGYQHGAVRTAEPPGSTPLPDGATTLAEILSVNGWRTSAVIANHGYLSPFYNFDPQGFHHYDARNCRANLAGAPSYCLRQNLASFIVRHAPYSALGRNFRIAEEINREAIAELKAHSGKPDPLFLFVNYLDAHEPYVPPSPYDEMFPGKDWLFGEGDFQDLRSQLSEREKPITPRQKMALVSQYDGGIAYMDHHLRELFRELRERSLYEDALIIVTADHGEAFGDRMLLEHGISVYSDQIHVPLLVKYPRQTQPEVVETPASGVDVLPTILAAAGLPPLEGNPGSDLRAHHESSPRFLVAESYPDLFRGAWNDELRRTERAVILGSLKFIGSSKGKRELYDLASDPAESQNIFRSHPAEARLLEDRYTAVIQSNSPAKEMDPATLQRLRSLGYVQ